MDLMQIESDGEEWIDDFDPLYDEMDDFNFVQEYIR